MGDDPNPQAQKKKKDIKTNDSGKGTIETPFSPIPFPFNHSPVYDFPLCIGLVVTSPVF